MSLRQRPPGLRLRLEHHFPGMPRVRCTPGVVGNRANSVFPASKPTQELHSTSAQSSTKTLSFIEAFFLGHPANRGVEGAASSSRPGPGSEPSGIPGVSAPLPPGPPTAHKAGSGVQRPLRPLFAVLAARGLPLAGRHIEHPTSFPVHLEASRITSVRGHLCRMGAGRQPKGLVSQA